MINLSNYILLGEFPHEPLIIREYDSCVVEKNKRNFGDEAFRMTAVLVLEQVNGAVLRAIRYGTKMSQEQFAQMMEFDTRTVKRLESRESGPSSHSVVTIISIAMQLRYSIAVMRKI